MSEPADGAARRAGRREASVRFVLVTLGIDALGVGIVIPVLPELIRRLSGHSISAASIWVALTVSAYAFAQLLAAPVLGGLSDRFGRRPVILLSVSGICLNYILQALAPTIFWVLVGRLMAGATAANVSASMAYIADVTPPAERAKRFGLVGATFGLGFVIGPALGGLAGSYSVRAPFVLAAMIAGLNALYGLLVLPESLPKDRRRAFDWRRANPVGALSMLLRDGFLRRLAGAWSGLWVGICVLQSCFVLFTTLRLHWGPQANGLALALVGLTQAAVQALLVQRVVRARGETRTALLGCTCSALSFVVFAFAANDLEMVGGILLQAAGSVGSPAIRAMLSAYAGPTRQGELQGATSAVEGFTQIGAPLAAGALFTAFTAPAASLRFAGAPFLMGAAMYGIALLLVLSAARLRAGGAAPARPAEAS